jgi:hypothetical protein
MIWGIKIIENMEKSPKNLGKSPKTWKITQNMENLQKHGKSPKTWKITKNMENHPKHGKSPKTWKITQKTWKITKKCPHNQKQLVVTNSFFHANILSS